MKTAEHQILTRIGFAERWLQRAREECLEGDVARGLLTLVLADAEVRRVLRLAVPPAPRSRSRLGPALVVGAGLIITAVFALQLVVLAIGAASVESAGLAPGLMLRPGTGALLAPLDAIGPQEPARDLGAPATPAPAPPAAAGRAAAPQRARLSSPPSLHQAAAPIVLVTAPAPAPAPPSPGPAPVPAASTPAPPAALSGVDLLDLVIVADRTLRRSQP